MKFSQRMGITPTRVELQTDSMDKELRAGLWNSFVMCVGRPLEYIEQREDADVSSEFFDAIWLNFYKLPIDDAPDYASGAIRWIRDRFFRSEWYEIYDFLEFVASIESPINTSKFRIQCNEAMERELSGYRFIGDKIAPIIDAAEVGAIQEAIEGSAANGLAGLSQHLQSALSKLSDRKKPDYRNSIKESISAVEGVCQLISGKTKATLGDALKTVKTKLPIHPALQKGFSSIYGYTSDEDGIRHAMIEDNKCDFDDAKYMLVSCSAFINYLLMKAEKAGIKMSV